MIISVNELKQMPEFADKSDAVLQRKLNAIESLIRAYTNNNFQNRLIRFEAPSSAILLGCEPMISVNDTVQITESVNQGLYVIQAIDTAKKETTLNKALFPAENNLITKVEYPDAVVEGVINMMIWEVQNRNKVGIQSETLSRHSVTYFAQDANNQVMGYPTTLLGFLKPYIKARF